METLTELQTQLQTINIAIQRLISGERLTQLIVGSGDFQRRYTYQECSLENLQSERSKVQSKIAQLQALTTEPQYRNSSPHQMSWSKT